MYNVQHDIMVPQFEELVLNVLRELTLQQEQLHVPHAPHDDGVLVELPLVLIVLL